MIGRPPSFEQAKAERISVAARLASEIAISRKRLENAVRDSLRSALGEVGLIYIEGEYVAVVLRGVETALSTARKTKSEREIAFAIEECLSAAIDAHLRELATTSSPR